LISSLSAQKETYESTVSHIGLSQFHIFTVFTTHSD